MSSYYPYDDIFENLRNGAGSEKLSVQVLRFLGLDTSAGGRDCTCGACLRSQNKHVTMVLDATSDLLLEQFACWNETIIRDGDAITASISAWTNVRTEHGIHVTSGVITGPNAQACARCFVLLKAKDVNGE